MADPLSGQVVGQVPDMGQIVRQAAGMVQTSGPVSGQVLAKASLAGYVIPSVHGLIMGQGLSSTNQITVGAQILPTHHVVVKEQVKPRGHILSKGQISVTSADPIQATSQILGQISGKVKTLGLVAGQVVAGELFPIAMFPRSVAEIQTPIEGKFQE